MKDTWTVTVEEDKETGDIILPFPEDMITQLGWQTGDILDFTEENGSFVVINLTSDERKSLTPV